MCDIRCGITGSVRKPAIRFGVGVLLSAASQNETPLAFILSSTKCYRYSFRSFGDKLCGQAAAA